MFDVLGVGEVREFGGGVFRGFGGLVVGSGFFGRSVFVFNFVFY